MRGPGLNFEFRVMLYFGVALLIVIFIGPGKLSYQEARSQADEDKSSFSARQMSKLEQKQASFTAQAFPACIESTGIAPVNFTVVVEIGSNGRVARSWRQGDSEFVVCFQRITTEYFEFRSIEQPFFAAFEYTGV